MVRRFVKGVVGLGAAVAIKLAKTGAIFGIGVATGVIAVPDYHTLTLSPEEELLVSLDTNAPNAARPTTVDVYWENGPVYFRAVTADRGDPSWVALKKRSATDDEGEPYILYEGKPMLPKGHVTLQFKVQDESGVERTLDGWSVEVS